MNILEIPKDSEEVIELDSNNPPERILAKENSKSKIVLIDPKKDNFDLQIDSEKDSEVNIVVVQTKESEIRISGSLNGEGSKINILGFTFANDKQKNKLHTGVIHNASRTTSDIKTKGIVDDEAKVLNTGLIKIEENSLNCEGYEQMDLLILNDKAQADSIPNLEINNNEVKCSHGSTVSRLSKDKLNYLKSRGLDEKEAERLMVEGFFDPIISQIENEKLSNQLRDIVISRLNAR